MAARAKAAATFKGAALVHCETRAAWRRWLAAHHTQREGIWLASWKTATGKPRMSYDEIVEEALCFGWVDSKPSLLDTERSALWLAPRKPRSAWSKLNKARVAKLIREKRMAPAGLAKVEAAKKAGLWEALDAVEALTVPPDLAKAFAANRAAKAQFEKFAPSSKKIILGWIATAKKPETRANRIAETVRLAAQGIKANHWRQ